MYDLQNKVVLITGGSRGIGRAISERLAEEGCSVAINYLNDHESAENLVNRLTEKGVKACAIQAHIGDVESRKDLWKKFDANFNRLDFFISNAATGVFRELNSLSLNSLKKVMAVNVEAFLELANGAAQRMLKKEMPSTNIEPGEVGRIISLSSIGAERTIQNYGSIGASKAALEAMTRQMAFELGKKGINCNSLRAGLVDTGVLNFIQEKEKIVKETISKTPNGRLVVTKDVACLVAFLLSSESSMINGQTIMVDGGHCLNA